jgi:hypothetical protein
MIENNDNNVIPNMSEQTAINSFYSVLKSILPLRSIFHTIKMMALTLVKVMATLWKLLRYGRI